jgi:hypothetical protein
MNVDQARTKIREITNTTTSDYSDASLIRDLNSELAMIQIAILRDRGVMEFDDVNHADLPIATLSMVAGQTEYKITEDEDSNLILTIHKVAVLDGDTYVDVPRKTVGEGSQDALTDSSTAIIPNGYYEVGNSVVFTQEPSQSGTFKVWFDRDLSQILTSDTTKILPTPTAYHSLACYRVGLNYAIDKSLPNTNNIAQRIQIEEARLEQFEMNRRGDESVTMTVESVTGL